MNRSSSGSCNTQHSSAAFIHCIPPQHSSAAFLRSTFYRSYPDTIISCTLQLMPEEGLWTLETAAAETSWLRLIFM
jgi:hypothetical protein